MGKLREPLWFDTADNWLFRKLGRENIPPQPHAAEICQRAIFFRNITKGVTGRHMGFPRPTINLESTVNF
jgi:hypothetical protein